MIKINLLHNQLSTPLAHERTGETMLVSDRTVASEARKSSRMVLIMTILFLALIAGLLAVYMNRYRVVAYLEQYTGPLNILAPETTEPTAAQVEEERRTKVRQLYMLNTIRIQSRDFRFLHKLDSLARSANPKNPRIALLLLEGNDFELHLYAKNAKEIKDFTKTAYGLGSIEIISPEEPRPNRTLPGYRFFSVAAGSVRVPAQAEGDTVTVATRFVDIDKMKKTISELAAKNALKTSEQDEMKVTKGVVMNKHRIGMRLEGSSQDFLKFLRQLNALSLNIEELKYGITYGDPKDKRRKPDVIEFDFNVLMPVAADAASADSSAR